METREKGTKATGGSQKTKLSVRKEVLNDLVPEQSDEIRGAGSITATCTCRSMIATKLCNGSGMAATG